MNFIADKQTLNDLNLLNKFNGGSVFNAYNRVITAGGRKLLEEYFRNPLTDAGEINQRSRLFRHFQSLKLVLPFSPEAIDTLDEYLHTPQSDSNLLNGLMITKNKLLASVIKDESYEKLLWQLKCTFEVLAEFTILLKQIKPGTNKVFNEELEKINWLLEDPLLKNNISYHYKNAPVSLFKVIYCDRLLRSYLHQEMMQILRFIYSLDVCISVSAVAQANDFCYADALAENHNTINAKDLYHPIMKNAVGNNINLNSQNNVVFLTGANMAGKSTLMKTIGIAVYLAHMGFPVAAKSFNFSVKEGIYSSINVSDDLNIGYSHFYAEVQRLKIVAQDVSKAKSLLVIFDELFKGTNVKDAFDATLAVTTAFAEYKHCLFIISTHIVEVGHALKTHKQLQFLYLPTIMNGNIPQYTYLLAEGISDDKQGMLIIENEGIVNMLRSVTNIY